MTEDQKIRVQLNRLIDKLKQFHWSPSHPSTYTITHPDNGNAVGIGIIAMKDPGAFNLVYATVNGALTTMKDQQVAVGLFVSYSEMVKQEVSKQTLSEWLTMLTKQEFKDWVQDDSNSSGINAGDLSTIRSAVELPELRKV